MSERIPKDAIGGGGAPRKYPGTDAKVCHLVRLADEYFTAAHALLSHARSGDSISSAPMRLCAIHAVEVYLNAFLMFQGISAIEIRGLQHDLARRTELSIEKGMRLTAKTEAHLRRLHDQREYLLVRYGPEIMGESSQLNRIFATLQEVNKKVTSAIYKQPYEQSDPRFKQYW